MKSEAFRDSVGLQGKEGRRGSDWWEGTALGSVHRTGIQGSRTSPLFPALCPWHWDISQWNSAVLGRRSSSQERQLPTNLASKCPSARSTHTLRGRGKRARGEHEPRRGLSAPPSFPNANSWSPPPKDSISGDDAKTALYTSSPRRSGEVSAWVGLAVTFVIIPFTFPYHQGRILSGELSGGQAGPLPMTLLHLSFCAFTNCWLPKVPRRTSGDSSKRGQMPRFQRSWGFQYLTFREVTLHLQS